MRKPGSSGLFESIKSGLEKSENGFNNDGDEAWA